MERQSEKTGSLAVLLSFNANVSVYNNLVPFIGHCVV